MWRDRLCLLFFFFNDTATTEIYTLSLHDALPIWLRPDAPHGCHATSLRTWFPPGGGPSPTACRRSTCGWCRRASQDRKSTRLNSSHSQISYAVFCLKKKKNDEHSCMRIISL